MRIVVLRFRVPCSQVVLICHFKPDLQMLTHDGWAVRTILTVKTVAWRASCSKHLVETELTNDFLPSYTFVIEIIGCWLLSSSSKTHYTLPCLLRCRPNTHFPSAAALKRMLNLNAPLLKNTAAEPVWKVKHQIMNISNPVQFNWSYWLSVYEFDTTLTHFKQGLTTRYSTVPHKQRGYFLGLLSWCMSW